jgi:DNA-binding winged helix-turn-helix (wHTH) protein/TolB-like protein
MTTPSANLYEFGEFRLDRVKRLLLRDGEVVALPPKAFETLLTLIENRDRVVEKSELMDSIWPDSFVEEANLTQNVSILRKALGERAGEHRYVVTVPGRGYRFVAGVRDASDQVTDVIVERHAVTKIVAEQEEEIAPGGIESEQILGPAEFPENTRHPKTRAARHWLAILALAMLLAALTYVLLFRGAPTAVAPEIKSLAVLPFRSLNQETQEEYLGLGVAADIITKISQSGELVVRPTSAVRKYVRQEMDALAAARELNVDAVLDSTYLHVGNQLRVTVNLLRVADGTSLWAEKFDERFTDIFAIQDKVSQQVAQRLRLRLSAAQQARLTKRYTSNPEAYSYYAKALYYSSSIGPDLRTRSQSDLAVDLFKKAIDLDPNYSLAHTQLGYAYARIAVFQEDNPALIEQAKQQLGIAERLDPQLAEVHVARYFIVFSQYEGWQVEAGIRELRLAQQLDPNAGHLELGDLYNHIGLEKQAVEEFETALKVDPNNNRIKNTYVDEFFVSARPEEGLEATNRFFNRGPDHKYYLEKGMVKEAAPLVEEEFQKDSKSVSKFVNRVLLLALQGKHQEAESAVPAILKRERRYRGYHHGTYNIARIYALGGKSHEALKWLHVTVKEGFPCYPLFARDPFLNRIRQDPAFKQFLEEMKIRWEGYQRDFG